MCKSLSSIPKKEGRIQTDDSAGKVIATKSTGSSSIPETHTVKGGSQLLQAVL